MEFVINVFSFCNPANGRHIIGPLNRIAEYGGFRIERFGESPDGRKQKFIEMDALGTFWQKNLSLYVSGVWKYGKFGIFAYSGYNARGFHKWQEHGYSVLTVEFEADHDEPPEFFVDVRKLTADLTQMWGGFFGACKCKESVLWHFTSKFRFQTVFWVNVFGPQLADIVNVEWAEKKGFDVEEVGGILIVCVEKTPAEFYRKWKDWKREWAALRLVSWTRFPRRMKGLYKKASDDGRGRLEDICVNTDAETALLSLLKANGFVDPIIEAPLDFDGLMESISEFGGERLFSFDTECVSDQEDYANILTEINKVAEENVVESASSFLDDDKSIAGVRFRIGSVAYELQWPQKDDWVSNEFIKVMKGAMTHYSGKFVFFPVEGQSVYALYFKSREVGEKVENLLERIKSEKKR